MDVKIKKSIDVFGVRYKIKFIDTDMFCGLCDPGKKTIFINKNQSKEDIAITYFHELFHAMQFSLGMDHAISREMMEILAENSAILVMKCLAR